MKTKNKAPANCQKCHKKRGELIRFQGIWICQFCLCPDWQPDFQSPMISSSAGELLEHGIFRYGESLLIYKQVQKHGIKSKFQKRPGDQVTA